MRHIIVFLSKFGLTTYITILKKLMTWVNSLGHVLFPFARWQQDHAQTPLATLRDLHDTCTQLRIRFIHATSADTEYAMVYFRFQPSVF